MKKPLLGVIVAIALAQLQASANVVGYVNKIFAPGDTLFTPPLWTTNNYSGPQYLSEILGLGLAVPDGTTVSLWDPGTLSYLPASTFSSGSWSIDYELNVGIGAKLTTSTLFTNTFVGELDGRLDIDNPGPVPHTGLGNGIFLLGNIIPLAGPAESEFEQIIGRAPIDGEQIIKLDQTYTYDSVLGWRDQANHPAVPTLNVAEAAFYNLGPVPEPSVFALAGMGLAFVLAQVRRRS